MLTRLIAHQIKKQQHRSLEPPHLRNALLPVDSEMALKLLDQLRDSLGKKNPAAGSFKTIGCTQPRFQQILLRYLSEPSDESFISFTHGAIELLSDEISKQPLATGGYVVFAEYTHNEASYLLPALLGTTDEPTFDNDLNLIATAPLDLDHLRHGARIALADVATNEAGVVHFVSHRSEGVSEYFIEFLGCEAAVRAVVQANRLFSAITSWATVRRLTEDSKRDLMGRAYGYWEDCRQGNRQMTLSALSNAMIPEAPDALRSHLNQEHFELAGEFDPPPAASMKRFVRFSFQTRTLKLEFDRNEWGNRITVDSQLQTLTIHDAPRSLITALDERD